MKRFILTAIAILGIIYCQAQTVDGYVRDNTYSFVWGTAADTLVANDSLTIDLRVQGAGARDLNFGLEITKVSGTVTNDFKFWGSMDGVNYTDSLNVIENSDAASGTVTKRLDNFNYPYLRVEGSAGGTAQKASYKLFYINRED